MDDRLLMENYLLVLKSTVEVFVHGTLESSNLDVRESLKDGLNKVMTSQKETYALMSKNGWYETNNVYANIILNTLNKVTKAN